MSAPLLSHTSPLKPLLYDLLYRAQQMPGKAQEIEFENNLLVEVLYDQECVYLLISREQHFPSLDEYWDIINCWPYSIDKHEPRAVARSKRKYLASTWPALSLPAF